MSDTNPARLTAVLFLFMAIVLVGCGGEGPAQPTGEKKLLRLNLKKGDVRKMVMENTMDSKVGGPSMQGDMNMVMTMNITNEVLDVDANGLHTLQVTYDRVRVKMTGGPMNVDYDSDAATGANDPMAQALGGMVGMSLIMTMQPDGKVEEVRGTEEFIERMVGDAPPQLREQVRQQMAQQTEGMKQALGQMTPPYPPHPVDIGDTWTAKMDMAGAGMPIAMEGTHTLQDRKDGVATIRSTGSMTVEGYSGKVNGLLHMDEATGWMRDAEIEFDMSESQQNMTRTMKNKTVIRSE